MHVDKHVSSNRCIILNTANYLWLPVLVIVQTMDLHIFFFSRSGSVTIKICMNTYIVYAMCIVQYLTIIHYIDWNNRISRRDGTSITASAETDVKMFS